MPCSAVMMAASSDLRALSSSLNAKRIWVRRASEVSRHFGNASAADGTTASTSASEANASWAVTSPVAGLVTSENRVEVPSKTSPFRQWCSVVAMVSFLTFR